MCSENKWHVKFLTEGLSMQLHLGGDRDWEIKQMIISLLSNRKTTVGMETVCVCVCFFISVCHSLRGWVRRMNVQYLFVSRNSGRVPLFTPTDEDVYMYECDRARVSQPLTDVPAHRLSVKTSPVTLVAGTRLMVDFSPISQRPGVRWEFQHWHYSPPPLPYFVCSASFKSNIFFLTLQIL